jgi:hypothetical protein
MGVWGWGYVGLGCRVEGIRCRVWGLLKGLGVHGFSVAGFTGYVDLTL